VAKEASLIGETKQAPLLVGKKDKKRRSDFKVAKALLLLGTCCQMLESRDGFLDQELVVQIDVELFLSVLVGRNLNSVIGED